MLEIVDGTSVDADALKKEMRLLWDESFDDAAQFRSLFFDKMYNAKYVTSGKVGNHFVCGQYNFPYEYNFFGTTVPVQYLYAIATYRQFRGQGFAREMIVDSIKKSAAKGELLTFLIPGSASLWQYYEKLQFARCFYKRILTIDRYDFAFPKPKSYELTDFDGDVSRLYAMYADKAQRRGNTCIIGKNNMEFAVRDILNSDGHIYYITGDKNAICGYIMLARQGRHIDAVESLIPFEAFNDVTHEIFSRYKDCGILRYTFAADSGKAGEIIPHAMARINDVYEVLKLWAKLNPQIKISFNLTGDYLPFNNQAFAVENGRVEIGGRADIWINIAQLTSYIMGVSDVPGLAKVKSDKLPYMSLMMD